MLPDEGRVLVYERASDGAGGFDETYTPGSELPCRIAPIGSSGQSSGAGSRINEASTHVVTFPAETEVRVVDRVEVAGVVYSVTALREFGALNFTKRVEVKALD